MNRKNQNKRREFLNNVCPTVALAFMGVTMLESCSSDGGGDDVIGGGGNNGGGNNGGGNNNNSGYTKSGNNIVINLSHSNFNNLHSNGWFNLYQEKILIIKISSTTYNAFTGSCPHQGTHTAWSYNGSSNEFVCGQHGNSYKTDCSSAGVGGVLKCYESSLSGNSLTVTKS
jgi:hypothetical protein